MIRAFKPEDAEALSALFYRSIHEVANPYYTSDQIKAWAPEPPDPERYRTRAKDGRVLLLVVDESDDPLAYGDLEPDGHIDHVYCLPEFTRTGLMIELYEVLETIAVDQGVQRLSVEASEPARRFFERRGFHTIGRREFTLRGVLIHNYQMEKRLGD